MARMSPQNFPSYPSEMPFCMKAPKKFSFSSIRQNLSIPGATAPKKRSWVGDDDINGASLHSSRLTHMMQDSASTTRRVTKATKEAEVALSFSDYSWLLRSCITSRETISQEDGPIRIMRSSRKAPKHLLLKESLGHSGQLQQPFVIIISVRSSLTFL